MLHEGEKKQNRKKIKIRISNQRDMWANIFVRSVISERVALLYDLKLKSTVLEIITYPCQSNSRNSGLLTAPYLGNFCFRNFTGQMFYFFLSSRFLSLFYFFCFHYMRISTIPFLLSNLIIRIFERYSFYYKISTRGIELRGVRTRRWPV